MTITLEEIKTAQAKVGEMIAAFEGQATFASRFPVSVPAPALLPGEKWICAVIPPNGAGYHLALLPGTNNGADHDTQLEWSSQQGGDLPDLTEQALLRAYAPDEFQKCAYWSKQKHATESGWAWSTDFGRGTQRYNDQNRQLPARAVRRLVFQ
jgi:hypothetical protein